MKSCRSPLAFLIPLLMSLSAASYGQAWSGILAPSRAFDWSNAGLPATLPDGETTPNPWTPPTRTQCTTSACNTVSGGSVTAATINAALASAPGGTYVLIPSGTFALGGDISASANNVTLRGSGAAGTTLTGGGIGVGGGYWGGATLLTANPAKGATSITVQSAPSAGRLASIEQCDDGFAAANANFTQYGSGVNCTGSYSDPRGPWVCGLSAPCARSGSGTTTNPHFQEHAIWIPAGGVNGNTVNFTSPLANANWSTARTAALTWLNTPGVVGFGVEDLTIVGGIGFTGTYACWLKGLRVITTSGALVLSFRFDAHSLVSNSYIASTVGGSGAELILWGWDGGEDPQSDFLFLNNIIEGGYAFGYGDQIDHVYAYNYFYTADNSSWVENGEAMHHAGTSYLLREGNQEGMSQDDDTWGTHNFNTWFRDYISCKDPVVPSTGGPGLQIGSWARFENLIGNALGGGSCSSAYQGTSYGDVINFGAGLDSTGLTQASLMRWGNYVLCSGDSHCNTSSFDTSEVPANLSSFGANSTPFENTVPADNNLPASFFMKNITAHPSGGTGLNWWKTCSSWTTFPTSCASYTIPPMPPIGPDVTGGPNINGHAWNIPAAVAWASLPYDTNYSTAWGHLRQFDERVYATDSGGGTSSLPAPPTGLSGVAK
jgi:hypothetical protein